MHLPPPLCVPPVKPIAPVVAVVKAVPKAAPKPPPPPKKGPRVPYGSYCNICEVLKHFGGHLHTVQRGVSDVNVCPSSRLEGAGQCPWRAGRHLKPSHLNPLDLLDHLARDHGSDPAQRVQVEAMITVSCLVDSRGPSRRLPLQRGPGMLQGQRHDHGHPPLRRRKAQQGVLQPSIKQPCLVPDVRHCQRSAALREGNQCRRGQLPK